MNRQNISNNNAPRRRRNRNRRRSGNRSVETHTETLILPIAHAEGVKDLEISGKKFPNALMNRYEEYRISSATAKWIVAGGAQTSGTRAIVLSRLTPVSDSLASIISNGGVLVANSVANATSNTFRSDANLWLDTEDVAFHIRHIMNNAPPGLQSWLEVSMTMQVRGYNAVSVADAPPGLYDREKWLRVNRILAIPMLGSNLIFDSNFWRMLASSSFKDWCETLNNPDAVLFRHALDSFKTSISASESYKFPERILYHSLTLLEKILRISLAQSPNRNVPTVDNLYNYLAHQPVPTPGVVVDSAVQHAVSTQVDEIANGIRWLESSSDTRTGVPSPMALSAEDITDSLVGLEPPPVTTKDRLDHLCDDFPGLVAIVNQLFQNQTSHKKEVRHLIEASISVNRCIGYTEQYARFKANWKDDHIMWALKHPKLSSMIIPHDCIPYHMYEWYVHKLSKMNVSIRHDPESDHNIIQGISDNANIQDIEFPDARAYTTRLMDWAVDLLHKKLYEFSMQKSLIYRQFPPVTLQTPDEVSQIPIHGTGLFLSDDE